MLSRAASLVLLGSAGFCWGNFLSRQRGLSLWGLQGKVSNWQEELYCSDRLLGGWAALSGTCLAGV